MSGCGLSRIPAWLSGRRGLAGLTGLAASPTFGGGGTARLSRIPAWLSGRRGLAGFTGSPTVGGLDTRFKEAFLSPFGGHSLFRSFGGGYSVVVFSFSSAGFAGLGGVGFRTIRGCEAS